MPAIYSDGLKFFSFSSLRLRAFAEFLFLIFAFLSPSRDSYCFLSVQIRLIRPIRVLFFSPLTTSSSFPPPQYAIRHTTYALRLLPRPAHNVNKIPTFYLLFSFPAPDRPKLNSPTFKFSFPLRTLVEEFAKIKSGDVVLPTRSKDGKTNKTVRLRCVTIPDEAPKVLLNRLGLILPQRLR